MVKRKNRWEQQGKRGKDPQAPGSWYKYRYRRALPRDNPGYDYTDPKTGETVRVKKLPQQAMLAEVGRKVGEVCEGKEKAEFRTCRSKVIGDVMKSHGYEKIEGRYQKVGTAAKKTAVKK